MTLQQLVYAVKIAHRQGVCQGKTSKVPTGAFIAALRLQTRNLSGRGPSILLRKTVLSLKSPTGAFIAPLHCANANF